MVTQPHKAPAPAGAPTIQDTLRVWRGDHSISSAAAQHYLRWISRLRRYCRELHLDEAEQLTHEGAQRFLTWYANARRINTTRLGLAGSSVRALRRVYEVMGLPVPLWRPVVSHPPPATALLQDYANHLRQHRGNPEVTIHKKLAHVGKSLRQLRLPDIDAFLVGCSRRYARSTTADIASAVRSFARFLLTSGRLHVDLADSVISPAQPRFERPRPALPWDDVQRLLRSIDTSTAGGLRDHAMLLMMSTYGLGAGEVIRLQLHDIDWNAGTLQMTRPKTGVHFVLPLLAPVAKVLARYLRHGRPPYTPTRHVFVRMTVPFSALTASSAVRHILVKHAKAAGIEATYLGSHVLRYSNAARQIDIGTTARVLSDLLGHRDPESVSAYVRVATRSLREVSLPVPR